MDEKEKDFSPKIDVTSITEEIDTLDNYTAAKNGKSSLEDKKKNEEIEFNLQPNKDLKENTDDGVVFATADTNTPKKNAPKRMKVSKGFSVPKPAIVATAAVAVAVAVGGVLLTMNNGQNGSVPTATQSGGHLVAPVSEASYELTNINTNSIVFGDNVTIEGIDLSGKTLNQAFDAMQDKLKSLRSTINIDINCENNRLTLTENDFQFDSNLSEVLIQAYHMSRGELLTPTIATTQENGKTDFKLSLAINSDSIDNAVQKAAKEFDTPPLNARVTKFDPDAEEKFTYADGSDGYLIDQTSLKASVQEIIAKADKSGSLSIKRIKTPYTITLAQVKANTKLIASHRTTVNNRYESNHNMELAIEAASGTEVKPGEIFSFNEMTGDTTVGDEHHYKNGTVGSYLPSTAIVKGEHVDQYGGGICQSSTTIYNCAIKANMEIVERHSHQFPSFYCDLGLDATVDYGNLDMRFKNNNDYSVFIATYVYDSNGDGLNELNVEMYGPVSDEYDEIVPVGWVTSADYETYSATGAQVYIKDGKEIKRTMLPSGSYDYYSDGYWDITSQSRAESKIADDPENGPAATPTYAPPAIYSPSGCGSSAPIDYGTASEYLKKALGSAATSSN